MVTKLSEGTKLELDAEIKDFEKEIILEYHNQLNLYGRDYALGWFMGTQYLATLITKYSKIDSEQNKELLKK